MLRFLLYVALLASGAEALLIPAQRARTPIMSSVRTMPLQISYAGITLDRDVSFDVDLDGTLTLLTATAGHKVDEVAAAFCEYHDLPAEMQQHLEKAIAIRGVISALRW